MTTISEQDSSIEQNLHEDFSKAPIKTQLEPTTQMDIPSYAFEWESPETGGFYGSFLNSAGNFLGTLGLIPCCCCQPNYKQVEQGEVGLIKRFGKLYKGVDPGLVQVNQCTEKIDKVSTLLQFREIPSQDCMTKDNVNVSLSSIIYYKVVNPVKAVYAVENLSSALSERTQTTLRHVVGARNLQEIIEKREEVAISIEEIISETLAGWGVQLESILIKDIRLPPAVESSLSKGAEAKRIGESKIITAKAEVEASKLMRKAADILNSKAAMQIRYLDAMMTMLKSSNSKVIFMPGVGSDDGEALSTLKSHIKPSFGEDVNKEESPEFEKLHESDPFSNQNTGYNTNAIALQESLR